MFPSRVLIISRHPLFAESLARLTQKAGGEVMARVTTVENALPLLQSDGNIAAIIVDYAETQGCDPAWLAHLQPRTAARRIIFLTLHGNEMIVHEQQRVSHVSEAELLCALHDASWEER